MCNTCNSKIEFPKADCSCSKELIDAIPFIHTQIMEAVGRDKNFPNIESEAHYLLVANKTRALIAQMGFPNLQLPSFADEFAIVSEIQATKPGDLIALLEDRGTVSPAAAKVLETIWGILDRGTRRKFTVNALEELYGYVNGIQNLPPKEKIALLYGLHVAKASVNFFARVRKDKNSPYYSVLGSGNALRRPFPWADCIGGVLNCIGCSEGALVGCLGCASISSGLASSWFGASAK